MLALAAAALGWTASIAWAAIGAASADELSDGHWAPTLVAGAIPLLIMLILGRIIRRRLGLRPPPR